MVMVRNPISWIGKGFRIDRRRKETNFNGFENKELKLKVHVEDCVLIRNEESGQPESLDFCYVACVKRFFEKDCIENESDDETRYAEIQWYSRMTDIRQSHQRLLIDPDYNQELLQDRRSHDNIIDVETIFGKCSVIFLDHNLSGSMFLDTTDRDGNPIFFCRWIYDGTTKMKPIKGYESPKKIEKIKENINEESKFRSGKRNLKKQVLIDTFSDDDFPPKSKARSASKTTAIRTRKTPVKPLKFDTDSSFSDDGLLEILEKPKRRNTRLHSLTQKPNEINRLLFDDESSDDDEKSSTLNGKTKSMPIKTRNNCKTPARYVNLKETPKKTADINPIRAAVTTAPKKPLIVTLEKAVITRTPTKAAVVTPKKTPVVTPLKIVVDNDKTRFSVAKKKRNTTRIELTSSEDEIEVKKTRKNNNTKKGKMKTKADTSVKRIPARSLKKNDDILPNYLPCREVEFDDIYSFIEGKLIEETGGCMYISGVPGTGKTASIKRVINYLREKVEAQLLPEFKLVEVNAMNLTAPHQCYVQILKQLTGKKASPDQALQIIQKTFANPDEAVVMVIDELDLLWTKRQDVMYSLFDWPNMINSKLIVLAIANTMDLPERLMMNRVSSRLGLTRKTFHPYTHQQLQEIVKSTMENEKIKYNPDAIQLVSRKVAAVSGDARRAIEIWKRAKELAIDDKNLKGNKMVELSHVDKAFQEMFCAPKILAIRSASLYEKYLLQAIVAEFLRTGLEESTFGPVYNQFLDFCRVNECKILNHSEVSESLARLHSLSILLVEHGKGDILQRIRLNVSVDDVNYALRKN